LEDQSERPDLADPGACVLSFVSARELVSMLSLRLLPMERAVLGCLADGLGPREIGRRLKISHTMVLKHRSKIASLLDSMENSAGRSRRLLSAPLLPPAFISQNSRLVA
jgi:DNA-binding CsgD family transcriptional regulator